MRVVRALFLCCTFCCMSIVFAKHTPQVDVVYTWVNGADPEWQKVRHDTAKQENVEILGADAQQARRFRDNNELKYSLRALHMFAPWIHHIYIVTYGHKPEWLQDHPKISIVSHKEIFKHQEHLPTFNSMAIESNIHRIPGLLEHYIYFNDDVFVGRPVSFSDFFTSDGKIKVFLSRKEHPYGNPARGDTGFIAACKNTSALIYTTTQARPRFLHAHTPYPSRKSLTAQIETMFPDIFEIVSSHRFRSIQDYTITNGLIPFAALHLREAVKADENYVTCRYEADPERDVKKLRQILKDRPLFFCIQDGVERSRADVSTLQDFFTSYFPIPAPWEKPVE